MDVDGQQARSSLGGHSELAGEQQRGRYEGPCSGGVIDDALDRRGAHPVLLQERDSAGRWCRRGRAVVAAARRRQRVKGSQIARQHARQL